MYVKIAPLPADKKAGLTEITPLLASNFIEMGYGLQVECMQAEMLFNRSFEPFFPYRVINKQWYDLCVKESDPMGAYYTDWSRFDWYHSGYEHNAWFAFPNVVGRQPITDESTFVIQTCPVKGIEIAPVPCDFHGKYAMSVRNESTVVGGLAQEGQYVKADVPVHFSGYFKADGQPVTPEVALFAEGTTDKPVALKTCGIIPNDGAFHRFEADFSVPETGRYTFAVLIPPASSLVCDDFSLMPDDRIGAWKKDAVNGGRYISPGVIRWPGGCFASFYDWHEGIGKHRKPDYSYFWGGYNYNDIGTDEFGQYVEALGCRAMVCVNVFHPFKRYFDYVPDESKDKNPDDPGIQAARHGRDLKKFADKEAGIADAAAWVEYCNGSKDTYWGSIRAENGHPEPYGFTYWELDNEIHRWYTATEYAETCVAYARAMKAVDPSVKIGMISYAYGYDNLVKMLDIAGDDIDFLADRGCSEGELLKKLSLMRAANEKFNRFGDRAIKYCNTEWLPLNNADVYNMVPRDGNTTKSYLFSKWSYALDAASMLMMWQRYGNEIGFINFNNMANTHSQSAMENAKEGTYITCAGMILHEFARTRAAYNLRCVDYIPKRNDAVQVNVALDAETSRLVVNILNRSGDGVSDVKVDTSELGLPAGETITGTVLDADSRISMNTLNDRRVRRTQVTLPPPDGTELTFPASRYSFSEYVITLKTPL